MHTIKNMHTFGNKTLKYIKTMVSAGVGCDPSIWMRAQIQGLGLDLQSEGMRIRTLSLLKVPDVFSNHDRKIDKLDNEKHERRDATPCGTFTDHVKPGVRPGARYESASHTCLAAPAMNVYNTTNTYILTLKRF